MELSANEYLDRIEDAIEQAIIECIDDRPDINAVLASLAKAHGHMVSYRTPSVLNDQVREFTEKVKELYGPDGNVKPKYRDSVFGDQQRVYGDELITPDYGKPQPKLPKLKPQGNSKDKPKYKPGITKQFKGAINFDCPTCKAQPFTSCFKFTGPGTKATLTNERNDGSFYHAKRQDLAKAYNDRIRKANILP